MISCWSSDSLIDMINYLSVKVNKFNVIYYIILLIVIVGGVLFGTVGNFLGTIASVGNGISDAVSGSEGYVYKGGSISGVASSVGNVSSAISNTNNTVANANNGNSADVNRGGGSSSGDSSKSSSSGGGVVYEDYQHDYETGLVDSEGNPIYLTIISTSGGQMEPGIYEVYWSALGPINQTRIG